MSTITYHASSQNMGDTDEKNCEKFREWANGEIEKNFPGYEVGVLNEQATRQTYVELDSIDEAENEDRIVDFCARLLDSYPWSWV